MSDTVAASRVLGGEARWAIEQADCLAFMASLPADSCDLVFGSPPYMDARTYGIGAERGCLEWVEWMLHVTEAAVRVSKGLVLWVVAGVQRDLCYWPGCEGLAWEWWKRGNYLWRPCIWWKVDDDEGGTGIPGSGGKQWLRNDWEYVLAFKKEGWLPWADPLVMGHEPVYGRVGGEMSNRTADGRRINEAAGIKKRRGVWNTAGPCGIGGRRQNGDKKTRKKMDVTAGHDAEGNTGRADGRPMPKVANPGNCLIVKARVGGGHMGSKACHANEAPFPERLAEFFVLSFAPPNGIVLDPFSGSGTTGAVAIRHGRRFLGCDVRESQVQLGRQRLENETPFMFTE
jgi:hypothetical protein